MVKFHQAHWALIVGGSSGLGLATAEKLSDHGMNLCIIHRSPRIMAAELQRRIEIMRNKGVTVFDYNSDAVNPQKIREVIADIRDKLPAGHKIRCLVHSIAKGSLKHLGAEEGALSGDDFRMTIDAMAISLYEWTSLLVGARLFADDASVISFTSEGSSRAWMNYAAVSAAKSSLEAISRSIALEYGPIGIRSNCIQAGVTDTAALRAIPNSEELITSSLKRNPMKRLTQPRDVANIVYLLCQGEALWINGTIIKADGGESLQ